MKRLHTISVIAVAVAIAAAGNGIAGEQPGAKPANPPPQSAPRERTDVEIWHDHTVDVAKEARDAGTAATDALCRGDRAKQQETRKKAEEAMKKLDEAAGWEADQLPEVKKAHDDYMGTSFAVGIMQREYLKEGMRRSAEAKKAAYEKLKAEKAKEIAEATLREVSNTRSNASCPAPAGNGQQRNATGPITPPASTNTPAQPQPATPERATGMIKTMKDPELKAVLSQPGLRERVETLLGLGSCKWNVQANVAGQPATKTAASYLNELNDQDLLGVLSNSAFQQRLDAMLKQDECSMPVLTPYKSGVGLGPVRNRTGGPDPLDSYGNPRDGYDRDGYGYDSGRNGRSDTPYGDAGPRDSGPRDMGPRSGPVPGIP